MASREEELAELYELIKSHRMGKTLGRREKELLAKRTGYLALGNQHKGAFLRAIALGAVLNAEGLLELPDSVMKAHFRVKRSIGRFLVLRPELFSITPTLREHLLNVAPGRKATNVHWETKALSPRGQKGRLGSWPGRRRP